MTKALPRQLEFPLLVNVNVIDQSARRLPAVQEAIEPSDLAAKENSGLVASGEDLAIYRSIGESFIRQFR